MNLKNIAPILRDDETVYVFARSSIFALLPWLGIIVGLLVIGGFLLFALGLMHITFRSDTPLTFNILLILTSAYLLLIVAFIGVAFIDYYFDIHIVTDRRIIDIDRKGLFAQNISELLLEDVEDVSAQQQGVLSTLFNFGNVFIETSGEREQFLFNSVFHPVEISELILDLSTQAKIRIEHGEEAVVLPTGKIKGVINNHIYSALPELAAAGVVAPGSPADKMVSQPKTASTPSK